MIFRPELAAMVMAGEKTVTRRLISNNPRSPWFVDGCGYRIGQRIAICPGRGKHAIGHVTITDVARVPLGDLPPAEAHAEGFDSPEQFTAAWHAINGSYSRTAHVWRIGLGCSDRAPVDDEAAAA